METFKHPIEIHNKNLRTMYTNMPDLLDRIRECETILDKFTLCAVALGKPELMNQPFAKMLLRKIEERAAGVKDEVRTSVG